MKTCLLVHNNKQKAEHTYFIISSKILLIGYYAMIDCFFLSFFLSLSLTSILRKLENYNTTTPQKDTFS